jgi:hypothetical protein
MNKRNISEHVVQRVKKLAEEVEGLSR